MQQAPATSTPPRVHQPAWVRWCGVVPLLRHPSRRLRRAVLALVALAALGATGFALGSGLTINLTSSGPQPATASAALGDTVTFVNQDSAPHAIVASGVGLTTPALTTGQPFPYVLTKSGTLNYRQTGEKNFQGEIDVQRSGEVTLGSEVQHCVHSIRRECDSRRASPRSQPSPSSSRGSSLETLHGLTWRP